jgi:hypothetical protein
MIFSENRFPLFGIMLYANRREYDTPPKAGGGNDFAGR